MERVILWDFDGTLAARPGMWAGCLVEVLDEHEPGHGLGRDEVRPLLRDAFPWHEPERAHPELSEPGAWWAHVEGVMASAYESLGFRSTRAGELAHQARWCFLDPATWVLFSDTVPVLERLRERGWAHVIVSNHVPELEDLVRAVGLGELVSAVITSARVGYDKPHPGIFEAALRAAGHPSSVWMVGDHPVADVEGAQALGIPAILVRREGPARRASPDLEGVESFLDAP